MTKSESYFSHLNPSREMPIPFRRPNPDKSRRSFQLLRAYFPAFFKF